MSPASRILIRLLLSLALATSGCAQNRPGVRAIPGGSAPEFDQAIYKGVVGNVLEAVAMDPSKRVDLQRANAIVSNTASGRSLAVLIGLSNPVFMIVGLVWGIWSASNIKPVAVGVILTADPQHSGDGTATPPQLAVVSAPSIAVAEPPAKRGHELNVASANSAVDAIDVIDTDNAATSFPHAINTRLLPSSSMQAQ